jgi:hypothetical protein
MGYLSNFEEDVFISYAHFDDDMFGSEECGWVTRLHQDLTQRVRSYLGSDVNLWRDCEIRNNEDFTKKILSRLIHTAAFLSVLSPSFLQRDWCKRELESFTGQAEGQMGILIAEDFRSRIFKVEKMPVERSDLPPAMQGTKTYLFYRPDPSQPQGTTELRPLFGGEYYRLYLKAMDGLAKDIAELLKSMAKLAASDANSVKPDRPIVYVAETTLDLDDKVTEVRRDLADRGFVVLPDGDLPTRADAYKDKVRDCLKQAVLSVHLVGAGYGFVPEGETKSNVWLQHDLAMERGKDANFFRLIWTPGEIASPDARQQEFITQLHDEAGVQRGADLLNGNIEELKTVIYEKLTEIRKRQNSATRQPAPAATAPATGDVPARAADDPIHVYVMCDTADRKSPSFVALRKYLLSQRCEPILPLASDGEGTALQIHIENLGLCDACLIYYGEGSSAWFEQKMSDLRKYLHGRQPPPLAKAIYVAPPSADKDDVETLEAIVLHGGETFSPDAIEPFMQRIRGATARA